MPIAPGNLFWPQPTSRTRLVGSDMQLVFLQQQTGELLEIDRVNGHA